jgi:uncharacterized protein
MKGLLTALVILALLIPAVSAREGRMTLLAVQRVNGEQIGATADLHLEIKRGSGRVFLDTIPLTQIDTQISTRFAKDMACDFLDIDCGNYDFFYTIRADSSIVGGPSAGAATAALTVNLLEKMDYNERIAVTGTMNSGGIVGPVGGVKEKVRAASEGGIDKVLVPKGERFVTEGNVTIDLIAYGRNLSIEVAEVATLGEVVFQLTGRQLTDTEKNLTIDPSYLSTMSSLTEQLCSRTEELSMQVRQEEVLTDSLGDYYLAQKDAALNLTLRSERALADGRYYASASYCFGANVKYQQMLQGRKSRRELENEIRQIRRHISSFEQELQNRELKTLTDLQAFMVVSERLSDAAEQLERSRLLNNSVSELAFAIERYQSALYWSQFFGQPGKEFILDEGILKESCLNKIAEAEESFQYVRVFFPTLLEETSADISEAYGFAREKEYAQCLARASNAKANANAVLTAIGADASQLDSLIEQKLATAEQSIIEQAEQNAFPILGYSYWEYATSLNEYDKSSALLYSEYALEMSNLDIYFKKRTRRFMFDLDPTMYWVFMLGLCIGMLLGLLLARRKLKFKKKRKRKRLKKD